MADLYALKKPLATTLQKNNPLHPFEGGEDVASLEFLAERNDAAFLMLASHSKKRPHNLLMTRFFDGHILDMLELAVVDYVSVREIGGATCAVGMKPAFVFNGELFEQREEYKKVQNMFLDFYRGQVVEKINLSGLESVISLTALPDRLLFRVYRIVLKKSDTRDVPLVELQLMGPSIDFVVGRTRFAAPELMKQALRVPKELKPKKVKNVSTTSLGQTLGRVHVGDQKLDKIQTRKLKGLKNKRAREDQDDDEE